MGHILRILILMILLGFIGIFSTEELHSFESHRFDCGQQLKESDDLKFCTQPVHTFAVQYHSKENDSISIDGVQFNQILYLFWRNKYFGYIVYLNEHSKAFQVKEHLYNNLDNLIKSENSGDKLTWVTDKEIIIFRKFSYHQGQVIYLCKKMYMEKVDPFTKGYTPYIGILRK